MERFSDGRDWFFEKRLRSFLNFGLYTIEGWREQDQMRRFIPRAEYEKLIHRFNPGNSARMLLRIFMRIGKSFLIK